MVSGRLATYYVARCLNGCTPHGSKKSPPECIRSRGLRVVLNTVALLTRPLQPSSCGPVAYGIARATKLRED